jgi:protein TonB
MELKKSKEANIDRVRVPIVFLGLLFSGSLVLASFSYESIATDDDKENKDGTTAQINYEQEEVEPPEPETPPEQEQLDVPPPIVDAIIEKKNEEIPPVPDVERKQPPKPPGPTTVVKVNNQIIDFPDVEAGFPGGSNAMKKWIQENVVYPDMSMQMGDQGKVYLSFVVEPDGTVTNVKVQRGVSSELDTEAKRVVRKMPKWVPGEAKGKAVRTRCRLPITFTITG